MQTAKHLVVIILAILIVFYLINQCRKPRGWLGRFFLWDMGARHSALTDWGLSHLSIDQHFTMLDVGCGGGRTVAKLAALGSKGRVFGVDYAAASVAAARKTNIQRIAEGRVEIHHSSVSKLPFADQTFDLVTAVETHYYWPDLSADLEEIKRVLKSGGKLVIIAEAYKRTPVNPTRVAMKLLRAAYLSASEHRELFSKAGYSEVEIFEERRKGWLCVTGSTP